MTGLKNGYDNIAGFYDSVLGDSRETEKYILNKVKELFKSNHQSKPEALELGCGTGNNRYHSYFKTDSIGFGL